MRYKLLLLSILLWSNVSLLNSQTPNKSRINIYVSDKSDKSAILVGAHIRIISGTDSIAGITTKYNSELATLACFRSNKLLRDSIDLHISHIGYKPLHKRYSAEQFHENIYVEMEQDEHMLSQIVIVGQSVAMVIKGDTTIYNSASFKTMDGDLFAALLAQLPGIEIKGNKIYANGEEIKRVYVDGRNLFGANSANTLTDIEANDVKNVKIYEEENAVAKHLGDKTTPKDKVMDVITHSKRNVIRGGSISIAAGTSIEKDYSNKHEKRHSEDLSLYRNSETGSIRLTASNSKNDSHKDNTSFNSKVTPSEHTDVYLLYDYRRGDSTTIMTHANFKRNSNQKIETILSEYFPTDQYKSRTTENTSIVWIRYGILTQRIVLLLCGEKVSFHQI